MTSSVDDRTLKNKVKTKFTELKLAAHQLSHTLSCKATNEEDSHIPYHPVNPAQPAPHHRRVGRRPPSLDLRQMFLEQSEALTERWAAEFNATAPVSTASSATVSDSYPVTLAKSPGSPMRREMRCVAGTYPSLS